MVAKSYLVRIFSFSCFYPIISPSLKKKKKSLHCQYLLYNFRKTTYLKVELFSLNFSLSAQDEQHCDRELYFTSLSYNRVCST